MDIFDKLNASFDLAGLKEDEAKAGEGMDFEDVPHGDYEVKVVKLELTLTKETAKNPNAPMVRVWFEVLTGEYKNQKIFMNQMIHKGFGLRKANDFLKSLESGITVVFEDFRQYAELLAQIFDAIDGNAEYHLKYEQNDKGFDVFTIVERF